MREKATPQAAGSLCKYLVSLIEKGSTKAVRLDKLQITKSNLTESVCSFHPAHRLILLMVLTPHVEPHLNLNWTFLFMCFWMVFSAQPFCLYILFFFYYSLAFLFLPCLAALSSYLSPPVLSYCSCLSRPTPITIFLGIADFPVSAKKLFFPLCTFILVLTSVCWQKAQSYCLYDFCRMCMQ